MKQEFIRHNQGAVYYTSPLMDEYGIPHAFFTRIGGVSEGVFESLNFAVGIGNVKDDEQKVLKNYQIAAELFGLNAKDICRSYQFHTATVLYVNEQNRGTGVTKPRFQDEVDGLITDVKELLLSVRTADCVPILLCDKNKKVCAAVHAGWRGSYGGIIQNCLSLFYKLGIKQNDILAAIGPCAGVCCYEVGAELLTNFCGLDERLSVCFSSAENGKYMLDLTLLNELILEFSGIKKENISSCRICTVCNENEFFSHRRSGKDRGTMSAFIKV